MKDNVIVCRNYFNLPITGSFWSTLSPCGDCAIILVSTRPSSTSLSALNPYVASLAKKFIDVCNTNNLNVRVIVTFRSWDEQDVLYAQGRTKPGNIVTDAKGGESYHNWGLAFDCAPVTNGLIDWNAMDKFIIMGSLGQQVGLEWGGNWITFKINLVDTPHYQYTFGLSTEQLLDGVRPPQWLITHSIGTW